MGKTTKRMIAAAVVAAMTMTGLAHASERDDPAVQKKLRAMANADTDWHPDLAGEFNGMRAYAHGRYVEAMSQFLSAAYYADKLSQLSIGLMYLNGEGVAKDPVTAYAWLDLAAERGFENFVATRDRVKDTLDAAQIQQGDVLRTTLAKTYADAVAKPRLVVQLHQGQMTFTGSRTGFNAGIYSGVADMASGGTLTVIGDKSMRCMGPTVLLGYMTAPVAGCGGDDEFAKTFWQPDKYFASRDALWKSEVIVGPMQDKRGADSSSAIKKPL